MGEGDEKQAILEAVEVTDSGFESEAGLSRASRSDECDESDVGSVEQSTE